MPFRPLVLTALFALAGAATPAAAQSVATGKSLYTTLNCEKSSCHAGAAPSGAKPPANVNNIYNGQSYNAIVVAASTGVSQMIAQFATRGGISDLEAQSLSLYISSWFAVAAAPSCTLSASDSAPTVNTSIVLIASCTGSPTSYAWTSCSSTSSTCSTTSAASGSKTYSVKATNGTGTSPSASVTVNWQPAASGAGTLTLPSTLNLGTQTVGTTGASASRPITNSSGSAVTITGVANSNPAEFTIVSNACVGSLAPGSSCALAFAFRPSVAGPRSATITITSDGTGSPQSFQVTGTGTTAATSGANYTGLWWNAPDDSESGWGLNVVHGGSTIFGTWFTYDATGKGWWVTMILAEGSPGVFSGNVYETRGPPFSSVPFNPAAVTANAVGTATLDFTGTPRFSYSVKGQSQAKTIKKQPLGNGAVATCTYSDSANPATATNYTDIWYAAPAGSESGWGVNLTQQGDTMFVAWFTYEASGAPMWLVATVNRTAGNTFAGDLYRTTATPFYAFTPGSVVATKVGSATVAFANGNGGTFTYTVDGLTQSKAIVRQKLAAGYTTCQ